MSNKLDQIRIPKPCTSDWEEMTGNDRMRYCEECKKHVYNLSKMSRREAEALIATRRGNLCAQIVRQPDGSILTDEIPASVHQAIFRASPVASAVVTAILTISSSGAAHSPAITGKPLPIVAQGAADKRQHIQPQTEGGIASIVGAVVDQTGALITMATVKLIDKLTSEERETKTSEDGEYRFAQVDAGSYTLRVDAPGFSASQEEIAVQQGKEHRQDVTMNVGGLSDSITITNVGGATGGLIAIEELPLRSLYRKSELIVVARVGKSVRVESTGEARLMKTRLEVSSTLKGEKHQRAVNVYHPVYGEQDETYVSGERLLLFLNRSQEEAGKKDKNGYEAFDAWHGIKKLSEADLKVYQQRIDELAVIMDNEKPAPDEIVEWLVRCAEDPATRWEGLSELSLRTFSLSEPESGDSEESAEDTEAPVEEEEAPVEETESEPVEEPTGEEATETESVVEESSEPNFAALLTSAQKERLSQALFNIETITDKDRELIELVKHWDDGRLAPFLLSQLRHMEAAPPRFAEEIIRVIALLLKDKAITALSEHYSEDVSYEDEEAEAASEQGEDAEEAKDAAASRVEAKRNRSEMFRRFIALVDSKMKQ